MIQNAYTQSKFTLNMCVDVIRKNPFCSLSPISFVYLTHIFTPHQSSANMMYSMFLITCECVQYNITYIIITKYEYIISKLKMPLYKHKSFTHYIPFVSHHIMYHLRSMQHGLNIVVHHMYMSGMSCGFQTWQVWLFQGTWSNSSSHIDIVEKQKQHVCICKNAVEHPLGG